MQSRRPKPSRVSDHKSNHSGSSSTPRFKRDSEGGQGKRPRMNKSGDKPFEKKPYVDRDKEGNGTFSYLRKTNERVGDDRRFTSKHDKPAFKNSFGQKSKDVMDRFGKREGRAGDSNERKGRSFDSNRNSDKSFKPRFSEERGSFNKRTDNSRGERPFSPRREDGGYSKPSSSEIRPWDGEKRSFSDRGDSSRADRPPSRSFGEKGRPNKYHAADNPIVQGKKKIQSTPSDESLGIRLNRFIANAGVCARREADKLIVAGEIYVNGKSMSDFSYRVQPTDTVKYGSKILKREKHVYLLLNKPKDFLTTTDDPEERKTVMDLVKSATSARLYPVGRLDRNTTGLLVITNDGDLAEKLMHPSFMTKKIYQVDLDRPFSETDLQKMRTGITLEDGFIKADDIEIVSPDRKSVGIEIHSGRNRLVRRMFEHLEYSVVRLDRVMYAGLTKKDLPRGTWRYLSELEVNTLKHLV